MPVFALPAVQKEAFKLVLCIPNSIYSQILPSKNISIHQFAQFAVTVITTPVSPVANMASSTCQHLKKDDDEFLASSGIAESLELEVEDKETTAKKLTSVGRWQVKKPTPYGGKALWDQNSDLESEE